MITNTELKIFKIIIEPKAIKDIAKNINISESTASRYVEKLVDNGLAKKVRIGKRIVVERSNSAHAQQLNTFFREFPRLPMTKIFSYSNLYILSSLNTEKTVSQIVLITGLSRTKVYQVLNDLTALGIILKRHGYYTNPLHRSLQKFIEGYFSYLNFKKLKAITADSVILWQRGREFLFRSKDSIKHKNIYPTATSKFKEYAIQIFTADKYYFHTAHTRKLCTSEYIIHTILAAPNSMRNNMYACLLYQKTKPKNIIQWANLYETHDHIKIIIEFLEKRQKNATFMPPWEEYRELAEDYGIITDKVRK